MLLKALLRILQNYEGYLGSFYYLKRSFGLLRLKRLKKFQIISIKGTIPPISLRFDTSDMLVFNQVLLEKQYFPIVSYFNYNKISPRLIVDCGGNIGLTSYFFAKKYPSSIIKCYEPDWKNYSMAKLNLSEFQNVQLFQNAIWSAKLKLQLSKDFRDGFEWSIQTRTIEPDRFGDFVDAVTIQSIFKSSGFDQIDYLKVDVEGTEFEIFKESNDLAFLDKVKLISIEIHNEMGDREVILKILRTYNFKIFPTGELVIGFK